MNPTPPPDELEALRGELAALASRIDRLVGSGPPEPAATPDHPADVATGRRALLRTTAVAALGSVAAATALGSRPAAAVVGTMQYGLNNDAGFDGTALVSTTPGQRTLSVVNSGSNGYAYGGEGDTVYGGSGNFYAIDMTSGGTGARLRAAFVGVNALASNSAGSDAVGVIAAGNASPGGSGTGVFGVGTTYGGSFGGGLANVMLTPSSAPASSPRMAGELVSRPVGTTGATLWWTAEAGNPGVLRKLAGPETAGQLHLIDPARVYDSRLDPAFARSAFTSGSDRLVRIADAIDLTTGAVATAGVVPAGATAIAYNLTVVDTTASGFLAVVPGNATRFGASSINWSASGQILANGQLVKLDGDRRVRIFAGGGGTAHVLVDIQGYYL
jgi:hypothetical protein